MTDSAELLTLDAAAALIPGADARTLKRRARQGKLTVYRPGKAFLTTLADVQRMIEACRVVPKDRVYGSALPVVTEQRPLGLSSTALASAALDSALAHLPTKKSKR